MSKIDLDKFIGALREHLGYLQHNLVDAIDASLKEQGIGIYDRIVVKEDEQKPVEWSEEDESRIITICTYLQDYARLSGSELRTIRINEYCDWLKSLKERYAWKPSDEQMTVFKMVFDWYNRNFPKFKALDSLYNDLNKLKEIKL